MAVFDCMLGTMVVTGETCQAIACMLPRGKFAFTTLNIVYRTDREAFSTCNTTLLYHVKRLVGDKTVQKIAADNAGVDTWPVANIQTNLAFFSIDDALSILFEQFLGMYFLLLFFGRCIDIHEWKTDIGLGHDERIEAGCTQSYGGKVLLQQAHGLADVIASRAKRIAKMTLSLFNT